jgi:glycosyltransferase involved in cell wall biosynthesis
MKIALDLRRIKNPGIGRYMKCLTEAVLAQAPEHEYLLVLPPDAEEMIAARNGRVEKICSPAKYYSVREQLEIPRILRRYEVDLLHSPHFNLPLVRPCPAVVTIHDVIYLACKRDMPSRIGRFYYQGMTAASVRLADRVLTDSEFSKKDIIRYLHADPAKIEVIYPGVDPGFQRVTERTKIKALLSRYRIDENYILYTGIYRLRKNHAGLLRAFRQFLANGEKAKLVIAGPVGEGEAELLRLAGELGIAGKIIFTGFVPGFDLPSLYSAARVYACPSLYEGFGFTVLEAMACGVPVVCSAETSLPEIAGDAAIYVDPRNPEKFASALQCAFSDAQLRDQLIEKGLKNRQRFNWERAAIQTLAAYQRAAGLGAKKAICA